MTLGDIYDYLPTVGTVAGAIIATIILTVKSVKDKLKSQPQVQHAAVQLPSLPPDASALDRVVRGVEAVVAMLAELISLTRENLATTKQVAEHGSKISRLQEAEAREREIEEEVEERLGRRQPWQGPNKPRSR